MSKKKIDQRIRTLIENNVYTGHRSLFVIIGDHGRDQVVNLHYILSKAQVARRPSVLWCYKKDLGFSSHQKKRINQLKKKRSLGNAARATEGAPGAGPSEDPFELFLTQTDIRYTYYHETDRILGSTVGMLVLQDFEALAPNILARTVETVQGGGVIVLLLRTLASLKQLYTMAMDAHARYRTATHFDAVGRFNERFLLSLATNPNCLLLTDQLDVLPFAQHAAHVAPLARTRADDPGQQTRVTPEQAELRALQAHVAAQHEARLASPGSTPEALRLRLLAPLVPLARTLDQARALEAFVASLVPGAGAPPRRVLALTAGRGRGKSATMGLALAAAFSAGLGTVVLTSPAPENLKTLFEFVLKGLDALGWMEHIDYTLVHATAPEHAGLILRINLHRATPGATTPAHRQTLLYIAPHDAQLLGQAELVVIDEAAAIPLPLVQALVLAGPGTHTTWMATTVHGYEGTGRSLSMKLLQTLRETRAHALTELVLTEPIRYSAGDAVERWLHALLCLDAPLAPRSLAGACPHPGQCDLFLVNRDTLFSFHKASEAFLQRMLALCVASHYKNSPNDLQLMSDAPAHKLFVLLAPQSPHAPPTALPEILAVLQVALEGSLSRQVIMNALARGKRESGDLIPWTIAQQFQEDDFAGLSGARVVRIAVHPELQGMGYGSRAMHLLEQFYRGLLLSPNADDIEDDPEDLHRAPTPTPTDTDPQASLLMTESIRPRAQLKPLLARASDIRPPRLDWIGVAFGLTPSLFKFYQRLGYLPVYARQTPNDITGEHSAILLKDIACADRDASWLTAFNCDFKRRFVSLLAYQFRSFPVALCLNILQPAKAPLATSPPATSPTATSISPYDLKRLESYASNMLDYHMIMDLVPALARAFFLHELPGCADADAPATGSEPAPFSLSPVQSGILLALGLQHRLIEDLEAELKLPVSQLLAMFIKTVRKFATLLRQARLAQLGDSADSTAERRKAFSLARRAEHPEAQDTDLPAPLHASLQDDLDEGGRVAMAALKEQQRALIDSLPLERFAIATGDAAADEAWANELARKASKIKDTVVSVPRTKSADAASVGVARDLYQQYLADKERKLHKKQKKHK